MKNVTAGSPLAYALVACGGFFGGLARYGLLCLFPEHPTHIPWTTAVINILGSLLLPIVIAVATSRREWMRPALGTGFMGAFTTFSSYAVAIDVFVMEYQNLAAALIVGIGSLVVGLGAAAVGFAVGDRLATVLTERGES